MKIVIIIFKLLFIGLFLYYWLSPEHIVSADDFDIAIQGMGIIAIMFIFPIDIGEYTHTFIKNKRKN